MTIYWKRVKSQWELRLGTSLLLRLYRTKGGTWVAACLGKRRQFDASVNAHELAVLWLGELIESLANNLGGVRCPRDADRYSG